MPTCVKCGLVYHERYNNQCPRCGTQPASTTGGGVATEPGTGFILLLPYQQGGP